ncbi:MAG: fumarylacetoacetate hydrolase family protein [Myxococcales bacterium]|nr:fumarylacetoacetate hydrolase family protein [Myxococcales bacterium]
MPCIGLLAGLGDHVLDVSALAAAQGRHTPGDDLGWWDLDGPLGTLLATSFEAWRAASWGPFSQVEPDDILPLPTVRLLAPVARPGKLMCIGLNYRDHAAEAKMDVPRAPVMFAKFGTSVTGPESEVVIPFGCEKADYEAELAVVIGRRAKRVPPSEALHHVFGYTCFNDVSARDFQFADGQWVRAKAADTFAPMGPFVATAAEVEDPHALPIKFRLNGETMQNSNTDQLVFGIPEIIAHLSASMTLEPGDVIATGTPPGVGFARRPPVYLRPGDRMEVEIASLGILANTVTRD